MILLYEPQRHRLPRQVVVHVGLLGVGLLLEKCARTEDEAGRAERALERGVVDERLLHRRQARPIRTRVPPRSPRRGPQQVARGRDSRSPALPSSSTVQAPHMPTPHPSRTPNRRRLSRSASTSVWCGSAESCSGRPLTVRLTRSVDVGGHCVTGSRSGSASRRPRSTFSAVKGRSRMRTPVAR